MDELWLDKPFSNKFNFYSHKLDELWLDKPFSNLPKSGGSGFEDVQFITISL